MPHLNMPMEEDELAQRLFLIFMAKHSLGVSDQDIERASQMSFRGAGIFTAFMKRAQSEREQDKRIDKALENPPKKSEPGTSAPP